jgi:hypothetical protein
LMRRCWDRDPSKRPSFKEIIRELQQMKFWGIIYPYLFYTRRIINIKNKAIQKRFSRKAWSRHD